jgi:aerobic-type carbon monoxide dehydrogenase small subunit (CoxS/CutS family)
VLREELGLVGTQIGCDRAECGACAVTINGRAVYACATLAIQAQGKDILTIEGLTELPNPKSQTPNPKLQSFAPRTTLAQNKPPTSNFQLPIPNLQSSIFNLHPLQRAFVEHDAMQCGFCWLHAQRRPQSIAHSDGG